MGGTLHLQRAPDHLEEIYTTGAGMLPLPLREGNMEPFTQEELQQALSKGKPGKAVGVNQTHARVGRAFSGLLPFTTTFTPTSRCAPTGTRLSW